MLIHIRNILPAFGSHPFTPEGYAKASYWIPEDGFSYDELQGKSWSSLEALEADRAEFKEKTAGKTEIKSSLYWDKSLRKLMPDRWTLAYTKDKAWREVDGKRVPLYSQLKRTLYFKSIVLGYGDGILDLVTSKEVSRFVKEHCAASARLKAIALRAYEATANCAGYHSWTSRGQSVYVCLAAAISSLDSMASVLWGILFEDAPSGRDIPDMRDLASELWPKRKNGNTNRKRFADEFIELFDSKWFQDLNEARCKVVHRGAAPVVQDQLGIAFDLDLGLFDKLQKETQPELHAPALGPNMEPIHLDQLMTGFVIELEKWEVKVAQSLKDAAKFPSSNKVGILLGIEFDDQNLHTDSSGPAIMLRSTD